MSPTSPSLHSTRSPSFYAPSEHSASTDHRSEEHAPPTFFKSIRRAIVKAATAGSEPTHHDAASSKSRERSNRVGSSSRGAGVKPKRSVTATELPLTSEAAAKREQNAHAPSSLMTNSGSFVAGPSRGGFIVQSHAKATPTVATTTGDSTSLADLPPLVLPPSVAAAKPGDTRRPSIDRTVTVEVLQPTSATDVSIGDSVLPPSAVLARLVDLGTQDVRPDAYVPLIRLLARSVSLFPFPPPALAASTLSEVLAAHPMSPSRASAAHGSSTPLPTPSPAQIYLSQSHHLVEHAPPALRSAMLDLMTACVHAALESTGGMRETEKAMFWDEARRWADEARVEADDGQGGKRWVLPDADREALVGVLAAMTRGGRDLSDVPGLVGLLCTFVTDSLPVPRPPSPLFDPNMATPFIRTVPPKPSPHASSLALLTALHKFSAPHIYTASTLLAIRAALEVAKLREEQDIGGRDGVLDFLGAVVRFGEVSGRTAARRKKEQRGSGSRGGNGRSASKRRDASVEVEKDDLQDRDEILREVVSTVARLIGCEGLVSVIELREGQSLRDVGNPPAASAVKTSNLPSQALDLMRDLVRSPANQATKSLRSTLVAPPPPAADGSRPRTPVLLLVGALRSLRKAMAEHTAELEASVFETGGAGAGAGAAGESRWPSMLSLGLPFLWNGIRRVMQWENGPIDAEVLRLVEERLDAAERMAARAKDHVGANPPAPPQQGAPAGGGSAGPTPSKEVDDVPKGISFEEWSMAIEVLDKAKAHIGIWEQQNLRLWIVSDDVEINPVTPRTERTAYPGDDLDSDEEAELALGENDQFTARPGVLVAFTSLLRKVVRAWCTSEFTGPSDAVFTLLVSLAPHLSDAYARLTLDQCRSGTLCLPTHPEWLERTQELVKAFYIPPSRAGTGPRSLRRGVSPNVRARILQLVASIHSHVRFLPKQRQELVDSVIMPLLETSLDLETDPQVAEAMVALMTELGRDVLDEVDDEDAGPLGFFDRLRLLLVKMAKSSDRTFSRRPVSSPSTPASKRTSTFAPLTRYGKEGSPTSSRIGSAAPPVLDATHPPEVSSVAVMGLMSIFHVCLEHSTPAASEKAVVIYRDLLLLFAPSYLSPPDAAPEPTVSLRTRLIILQWLVRLRADASHRVHWIHDIDITGPAKILGRLAAAAAADAGVADLGAPLSARVSDDGHGEPQRGRTSRQPSVAQDAAARSRSASRLRRLTNEDRSPGRANSIRRNAAPPVAASPILWTLPEKLPFAFGTAVASTGSKGLASFDHKRMRNWTEEEDPGTGLVKVVEAEETLPQSEWMVVLPVSEYLRALNHILQVDQEWELVSYILCHIPDQASNKHFACGPRCAQQIHVLRKFLCDGLRAGDRGERVFPHSLPAGIKRAEIHAVAYQCLTALIAYRSLFSKQHQDDIVNAFMYGLGNPRDTAKPCIHALTIASFELRPSMTKHLAETVRHLQKIISSAELGVHILEFIAGVGQEPALYANFTDVDFQTVFGIALKYIQAHNERLVDDPGADEAQEGVEYAFSQYVLLLAYYNIAVWYLALRLSERPKFVPFLTRRLVQANEGKNEVDEATEVILDMIARYAYSNADPRPRATDFDNLITGAPGTAPLPPPKTWIVGNATITIRKVHAPAWVEVTVRRASGVVRMLWEMQNISMTSSAPESDLIAGLLRHRETAGLMHQVPSAVAEALAILPQYAKPLHVGSRARAASFSGTPAADDRPFKARIEDNAIIDVANSAAHDVAQITIESGALTVDPSFFAVQLSSFPHVDARLRPLPVPADPASQRGVTLLDTIPIVDFHKVGILYAGRGQTDERDILANTHGSKAYVEFISGLGSLVRLKGSRELGIYTGGLDQENDIDGKWTYCWDDDISQIVFHVATLMPTNLETDPQCTLKKRHIGNDFVKVVFNDSGGEFAFDTLPGDFNFVNIVIQPHTPAGNPWIGPGMSNNTEFFKVSMQCRPGMPEIGPLGTFKMVTGSSLAHVVRQLALHSNIFAQIFLASVGFETQRPAGTAGKTHRLEYSSNWRKRLQQIKLLKKRILDAQQGDAGAASQPQSPSVAGQPSAAAAPPPEPFDLDEAEASRLFTAWA
ncbi:Tuberous sclerosis 2-like protein [Rhodotorula kratochvilovae]